MALLLLLDESTGFYAIDGERAALPQIQVQIDFTNDPTNATRIWSDVTLDIRALTYTRSGRNSELQRTSAGSLSCTLDNRAGNYDATNTAGAYYPGVKRMRWIRVRANWAGTIYARWQGLIETWKQEWPAAGRDATCTITATDAFKVLNLFDLAGLSYGAQRTDQRVAAVLTSAGITSSTVSTGLSSIVASGTFAEGSSALEHLLQVEETENGLLFAEGDGSIVFQDRHYRLTHATSVGTIGDSTGEIPYRTGELDLDDADVWNKASVTPSGGAAQVWTNDASMASHYTRRLNRSSLSSDTAEALSAAQYLVGRYADPAPRIPVVEVIGQADTSKWPTILGAKNSDQFTWTRRATAHTISTTVFVERVSDTVIPGTDWQVRYELSPAADNAGWVLGNATFGLLGQTTKLVY